jgi:hypothetical protein
MRRARLPFLLCLCLCLKKRAQSSCLLLNPLPLKGSRAYARHGRDRSKGWVERKRKDTWPHDLDTSIPSHLPGHNIDIDIDIDIDIAIDIGFAFIVIIVAPL